MATSGATPPWWERAPSCVTPERLQLAYTSLRCPESVEKVSKCTIEERNGVQYRKCTELYRRFRNCPGRPAEELEVSTKETQGPYLESQPFSSFEGFNSEPQKSTTDESVYFPSILNSEIGQMFDEFLSFAAELERDLRLKDPSTDKTTSGHMGSKLQNWLWGRKSQSNSFDKDQESSKSVAHRYREMHEDVQEI